MCVEYNFFFFFFKVHHRLVPACTEVGPWDMVIHCVTDKVTKRVQFLEICVQNLALFPLLGYYLYKACLTRGRKCTFWLKTSTE